ncbi:putative GCN5-related N-acetyltransferase [Actinoplanes missouriensis 431]|uniref:Putative GCN5-related N-acetyltransferase n=1 Tax=Actinoplanes missouriensis (strain ATCC 14538 / DSM 43046 / CBS 188.64 / JCM 3121 / NBRC 102363 / NCIMB 12654 / NRRL B-3342 / UNCC 431) TaxID=512565 RepID=I0HCE2_ACTM4|nr:GNAT family protein [Actinoplanes missouriensis]BAL90679.1 putative GCN5-related N-acetyltransferase [Actinoplanes missouriensis 431]
MATERLTLRRFRASDAPRLAEYRSDPLVARYQSWDAPFPLDRAEVAVRNFAAGSPDEAGHFQYAVELTAERVLIGDVYVRLHDNLRQAEIGFTVDTPYQRRGFGVEAVSAVLDRLFRQQGLHRVMGECDARNTASAALLERLGFQREGRLRQQTFIKGEWTDDLLYGLLAPEWLGGEQKEPQPS